VTRAVEPSFGFGALAGGVWVSPDPARETEARQILADLGLTEAAVSFLGSYGFASQAFLRCLRDELRDLAVDAVPQRLQFLVARGELGAGGLDLVLLRGQ
jgi:hypothetical protein